MVLSWVKHVNDVVADSKNVKVTGKDNSNKKSKTQPKNTQPTVVAPTPAPVETVASVVIPTTA